MSQLPSLTILEEFLLLALDPQAGEFQPVPRSVLDGGVACAVLIDLMRVGRLDCDLTHVFLVNPDPCGDYLLDPALAALAMDPVGLLLNTFDEIRFLSDEGEHLRDAAMERLVDRGVLRAETRKVLWIFGASRYPVRDDKIIRDLKMRILDAVMGDEIPTARDIALVALAESCGLFRYLLNGKQHAASIKRITEVARMDMLAGSLVDVVSEVEASIAMSAGLR